MNDNTIPPNQDFQIPQDQSQNANNPVSDGGNATVNTTPPVGSTNPANNVNNINVSDPYDFVLQNSNPFVNSQDNPISDISNAVPNSNINTNTLLNNPPIQTQPQQDSVNSFNTNTDPNPIVQNQPGYTMNPEPPVQPTVNMNNASLYQGQGVGTPNYTNPLNINTDSQIPTPPLYNQSPDPAISQVQQTGYANINLDPNQVVQSQPGYTMNPDPPVQPTMIDPNVNNTPSYANQSYSNTPDPVVASGQNYPNPGYNPMNTTNTNQTYQDSSMQQQGQPMNSMYTQNANPTSFDNTQTQQNVPSQNQVEEKEEDFLSVLSYVLFINFFIIIISFLKKDEFLKFNSIQGFTFDITFLILFLIFNYLSHLLSSVFIIFLIIEIILFTIWILFSIFLMYKAYNGDKYKFLFFGSIADIVK